MKTFKDLSKLKFKDEGKSQGAKPSASPKKKVQEELLPGLLTEMLGKRQEIPSVKVRLPQDILDDIENPEKSRINEQQEIASERREMEEMISFLNEEINALRLQVKEKDEALSRSKKENAALQRQLGNQPKSDIDIVKNDMPKPLESQPALAKALFQIPQLPEKFNGEIREHLLEMLQDTYKNLPKKGQRGCADRKLMVLEAFLKDNPCSGELKQRREEIKRIFQGSWSSSGNSIISCLEKLGFKYVSGKTHHKFDYAGIRCTVAKTPSDYCGVENAAAEFSNRCF